MRSVERPEEARATRRTKGGIIHHPRVEREGDSEFQSRERGAGGGAEAVMARVEQHSRKGRNRTLKRPALRVNTIIFGEEYVQLFYELKERGLVRNLPDLLLRGLELLRRNILESDLKRAQLRTLKNSIDAEVPEEG